MKTFWDFCAPFYDLFQQTNNRAYKAMLNTVRDLIPPDASVLDAATGTGAIALAVADKASRVLGTDISENMLRVARRKANRRGIQTVEFENQSIYQLTEPDLSFDIVVAGQILHLIDHPEQAAAELKRVAKSMILLPMSFTRDLQGTAKLSVDIYRVFGFLPRREFAPDTYELFLSSIGFENCEHIQIAGKLPMAVAVWRRSSAGA